MKRKIMSVCLCLSLVLSLFVFNAGASAGDYEDYSVPETLTGNIINNPTSINTFTNSNGAGGSQGYTGDKTAATFTGSGAANTYWGVGPGYLAKSKDKLTEDIVTGKTYIVRFFVKNGAPSVDAAPNFAVRIGGTGTNGVIETMPVTDSENWMEFKRTVTATADGAVMLGFDTRQTSTANAVIIMDVSTMGKSFIGEEAPYDISVTASSLVVEAGTELTLTADVLNQIGGSYNAAADFDWYAVDENRTQTVDSGFNFTVSDDTTNATVSVGKDVVPGKYVLIAEEASLGIEGFRKGVTVEVTRPVIRDSETGTDPVYDIISTVKSGSTTLGVFDALQLEAAVVNSSNECVGNEQSFKWYVLNEARTDVVENGIRLEVSEDTKTVNVTLSPSTAEGVYYVVAESTAEESAGFIQGTAITVDKSGTIAEIADSFKNDTADSIADKFSTYLEILELSDTYVSKADNSDLAKLISKSAKSESVNAAISDLKNFVSRLAVVSLYNKNSENVELSDSDGQFVFADELMLSEIDTNDVTIYSLYNNVMSREGRTEVQKAITGQNYGEWSEFYSAVKETILLHALAYPEKSGTGYIAKVLTRANLSEVGIEAEEYLALTEKAEFNETIARQLFTKAELKAALAEVPESGGGGNSSSSGGSSSGSSSGGSSKKSYGGGFAVAATVSETDSESETQKATFADVPENHWAYSDIYFLKDLGVITGISETQFEPEGKVTREQFLKMIIDAFKIKGELTELSFTDVESNAWYTSYIKIGVSAGIITGKSADLFGVGEAVKRQDVCTMLERALHLSDGDTAELSFSDSESIAEYARSAVSALSGYAVIKGFEDNSFRPGEVCTRAQAAKIISNAISISNAVNIR